MGRQCFVLGYDFHLYAINMECKEVKKKTQYFDKIEELIQKYRELKNAMFCGCINYNDNFKIYRAAMEEMDTAQFDALM